MKKINLQLFSGDGRTIGDRNETLPLYDPLYITDDPADYITSKPLKYAVNMAIALGQPLLVTGEPGTGKTQLAAAVAHELDLPLLTYFTKTHSTAEDLFYRHDALGRFQDSHAPNRDIDPKQYITYQALGKAILLSMPPNEADPYLDYETRETARNRPTRSVVLIDEIDKAPRDLPNDMLNEIEKMVFEVKETEQTFRSETEYRPILIFTSNSEKNLPDPFLRRCVFFHIPFPNDTQLKEIILKKFKGHPGFSDAFIQSAIEMFMEIRKMDLKKPPATAELQSWIAVLADLGIQSPLNPDENQRDALYMSYSVLAKTREDFETLTQRRNR